MWFRSQDKKSLVESKRLGIEEDIKNNKFAIINYISWNGTAEDADVLGKYDTEERALRVLDTIQQKLIDGASKDVIANGTRYSKQFVFQMPQK
ncbi:hypothetical protein ACJDT4_13245 [Clostridium neuense]|uniref:Uncharacterized protein n=1 Tax=Clostridium neuense TaxID=1728934 RepID=A0ABW8TG35_9CLOT